MNEAYNIHPSMATMISFLKPTMASSSSKPATLLPLKWRRNPILLRRTTQIPLLLPSNTGFIKCSSSSSSRGSGFSVQCVMNNSKNCFMEEEEKRNRNPFERFAEMMFKALKALKLPAVIALLLGKVFGWTALLFWLLHCSDPTTAVSRTAVILGIMLLYDLYRGISAFSSDSRRRNGGSIEFPFTPALGLILIVIAVVMVVFGLGSVSLVQPSSEKETSSVDDTQKTTVLKLQVALLGTTRSLRRDLYRIRIAGTADTSTSEGLSKVLQETTSALLRHPDYCISGYSSVDVKQNKEDGQKHFNKLSIEERGESDAETLVNVIATSNIKIIMVDAKQNKEDGQKLLFNKLSIEERGESDAETLVNVITTGNIKIIVVDAEQNKEDGQKLFNKLSIEERGESDAETLVNVIATSNIKIIVITMLVAAEGVHELPAIKGCADLKEALQKLGSISSSKTMAVKVLWTPRNENDTLTERELLEDYPLLSPL